MFVIYHHSKAGLGEWLADPGAMRKSQTKRAYVLSLKKSPAKSFLLSSLLWAVLVVAKQALGNHKGAGKNQRSPGGSSLWDVLRAPLLIPKVKGILGFEAIPSRRLSPAPSPGWAKGRKWHRQEKPVDGGKAGGSRACTAQTLHCSPPARATGRAFPACPGVSAEK